MLLKLKLPSKERALLEAIRTTRSNIVGAREGLGRLAESSGMEGITLADMDKNYPVLPLPILVLHKRYRVIRVSKK